MSVGSMDRAVRAVVLVPIHLYRIFLSPFFAGSCRFAPSCSAYALEAVRAHGVLRGSALALRRFGRCRPWGGSGYDPVPPLCASDPRTMTTYPARRGTDGSVQ